MRNLLLCGLIACSGSEITVSQDTNLKSVEKRVVYGSDDRMDVYEHPDSVLKQLAREATVALMSPRDLDMSNPRNVTLAGVTTLSDYENLCPDQRFQNDPTSAFCSGTLIDEDIVLTAGHCVVNQSACDNTVFVFDYLNNGPGQLHPLTTDSVYSCKQIIARAQNNGGSDFAVLRIDRKATGRTPAPVSTRLLAKDDQVAVIGSGSGIPFKIDAGGKVRDPRTTSKDFFVASTDTFGGNSGSGVYSMTDHALVGILVRGETDYTSKNGCTVVNVCEESGCRGEDSTYALAAVDATCAAGVQLPNVSCTN